MHALGAGARMLGWVCPLLGHTRAADQELESQPGAIVLPLILAILLGAFFGLVVGLVLARLVGFAVYLAGREFHSRELIVVTTILGAAGGAWLILAR